MLVTRVSLHQLTASTSQEVIAAHVINTVDTACLQMAQHVKVYDFLIEMHINYFPCQMLMNAVKGHIFALICALTHQDRTAAPVQQDLNLIVVMDKSAMVYWPLP